MKKLIAIALVFVFALSFGTAALADTTAGSQDVTVELVSSSTTVYKVDLSWTGTTFTYTEGNWDPATHDYPGSWDKTEATVTVANHSNASVDVTVDYAETKAVGVDVTVENGEFTLATAEGRAVSNPDTNTATIKISGTPSQSTVIGTITVTYK